MDATSCPVAPARTTGVALGWIWGKIIVVERVTYTVGERMRHKWPRVTQPRLVVTNAAFEFRRSCIT